MLMGSLQISALKYKWGVNPIIFRAISTIKIIVNTLFAFSSIFVLSGTTGYSSSDIEAVFISIQKVISTSKKGSVTIFFMTFWNPSHFFRLKINQASEIDSFQAFLRRTAVTVGCTVNKPSYDWHGRLIWRWWWSRSKDERQRTYNKVLNLTMKRLTITSG